MKNFAKKLALFLAFAMVVTMVHPFSVSAASKITLKSGAAAPSTIYAGHTYNLQVKGTAVKFYTSNKKVATIGLTTGKMKPVAPGSVKITAKNKKTGKAVASKTFKVLQRAKSVTVDSELYLAAVGDTATLKATLTPATSTDVVRFTTSDKTIATVGLTGGKVTAKAEGETTINVYAKATKATSNSNKYNKVAKVKVFVGPYMASAKQTTVTDVELTFKADVKEVKAADFTVTNDTTKQVFPVKTATISKTDAKVVTISTYAEMKDGASYTVTYGKTSAQFTATDGKVASIAIDPTVVTVATETKIAVVAKDANGVQVGRYEKGSDFPSYIDFTVEANDGYVTGDNALYLNSKTSTAKAKAVYHTWKFDTVDGVQTEVGKLETGDVTITATEASAVSNYQYTLSKNAPAWASSSFKTKTDICVGETGYKAYFKFVDANNKEIKDYSNYTVSSSNDDVLLVTSDLNSTDKCVDVAGIKEGTAYLTIKNASTKATITTLAVTVKAEVKATNLVLDKTSVSVSNVAAANDVVNVGYKVVDQYNNKIDGKLASEVVAKSWPKDGAEAAKTIVTIDGNNLVVNAAGAVKGTYVFEIKCDKLSSKILTVDVKEPATNGTFGFDLLLSETSKDAVVKGKDDVNKTITMKPVMTKGGIAYQALGAGKTEVTSDTYTDVTVAITVKNSKGEDVSKDVVTDLAFNVTKDGKAIDAGTYSVTCEFTATKKSDGKTATFKKTLSVTITNSQPAVTFERVAKEAKTVVTVDKANKQVTAGLEDLLNECYTFYYDGVKYGKDGKTVVVTAHDCTYADSNNVAFKTVTIAVDVNDGVKAQIKVDLGNANTIKLANGTEGAAASEAPVESEAPAPTSEAPAPTSEAPVESEAPAPTSEAPVESEAPAPTSEAPVESEAPAPTSEAPAPTE